jgi:uncharacterized protein (DUF305 family)
MRTLFTLSLLSVFLTGCTGLSSSQEKTGHNVSMNEMNKMMTDSLKGKTGDAFDEAFIRAMIPHHEGAIDMARVAKENAKHEEIRIMADEIIEAQQAEIDEMNQWLSEWGYLKCTLSGCPLMDAIRQAP